MDQIRIVERVTKLSANVKALGDDDKEICGIIAWLCEALCELRPEIKSGLIERVDQALDEFDRTAGRENRSRTARHALAMIHARIDPN
jgi:hypothetical protein